jgi:hypothetical protein
LTHISVYSISSTFFSFQFSYNEVGGHLPYLYYPPKDEETKRKDSISLLGGLTSNNGGGEQSLLNGVDGETPTSPNMDDWFSPKLTHYTQGRAM